MVSDSIINNNNSNASSPRDSGKKKRANRSAKLKQCKLDARREQWLSQGMAVKKKKKGGMDEVVPEKAWEEERKSNSSESLKMRRKGRGGGLLVAQQEEEEEEENENENEGYSDSSSNSPTGSSVPGGTDSGTNFTGSSSSSSTSGSSTSGYCCSGNITEEEEHEEGGGGDDDNCFDDWEAVADALAVDADHHSPAVVSDSSQKYCQDVVGLDLDSNSDKSGSTQERLKNESARTVPPRLAPGSSQAWRPDDVFRPQSLPSLSKQLSFAIGDRCYSQRGGNPWVHSSAVHVLSSCPICCEELDFTDAIFLPCLCGFRLCLFCHKRILEEDGRCPGCRKPYKQEKVEPDAVHGDILNLRLARSFSMNAR